MNAAATLSSALLSSRRALPKNVLRQCVRTKSAATRAGSSLASWTEASEPMHMNGSSPRLLPRPPLSSSSSFRRHHPTALAAALPSSATNLIQRRSLFIQTATTPNPESLKFVPNGRLVLGHNAPEEVDDTSDPIDGEVVEGDGDDDGCDDPADTNGVFFLRHDRELIARSPLARSLFDLDEGVKSVYLGRDFLTVTKRAEAHWSHLQTPIFGCIMDFYASGKPAMLSVPEITDTTILDDDDEVVAMIKELLETRIRPAVQEDGGDIRYVGFEEDTGIVTVRLAGSCVGCPSSSVTLKNGVENMLMHYIPEVRSVVSLEEEEEGEAGGDGEDVVVEKSEGDDEKKKMKTYQDRLAAAGIPFSD
eukprot:CAMPEP_0172553954 /NCGR_PEP_ID=MMETSP1067-20121228/52520_1 /TAXON_ID=265564 ORGANISM="Thalassiosira punctigera, Strain Tpunct2005C2" /NCGR_SAMPLE_ID=MMETSP1067 /ASSEMBLY_ACC=CAM_ASM_000444 /LENGTH=362 /DNA_ID=CAMNT_0013342233 /DNA_START=19 /DNA_END=1107 /DNA_ORIENTATION=+